MKDNVLKFVEKKWRMLVIFIALVYIGMGAIQILFDFQIDPEKGKNIELVLMVIAVYLFIYGRKKEKEASIEKKLDDEEKDDV